MHPKSKKRKGRVLVTTPFRPTVSAESRNPAGTQRKHIDLKKLLLKVLASEKKYVLPAIIKT